MRQSQTLNPKCNGYTLLTMMIALATLTLITALVSNIASSTFNHHHFETIDRQDVWLFFAQTQNEIASSDHFISNGNEISFELNGNVINYKLVGTTIRRLLNGDGYEIVLQKVQSLSFLDNNQTITIEIVDISGRFYRWTIKKVIQ